MLRVAVTSLFLIGDVVALRLQETSQNWHESDEYKPRAVIVHCDNRPLNNRSPLEVNIADMTFVELASMVDFAYAQKHGYELCTTCCHSVFRIHDLVSVKVRGVSFWR
jgi:hypothetical protein